MNNKLNKVLVTGGAGCIGLPLCNELIKRGKEVVLYDLSEQIFRVKDQINKNVKIYYGSILVESSIREAIRGCDGVVHLAAYLGVRRTEINKIRCLDININGTRTVLDATNNARSTKLYSPIFFKFFFLTPFDPFRAGIIHKTDILSL